MPRFIKFKVPGQTDNVLINCDQIEWVGPENEHFSHIHFGDDHLRVEASIERIGDLLEAEYGQILDGTPTDG